MSDYTQSIDFSAKDALSTGDANKVAKGADLDTELGLISTAVATKYDSTDLSTDAQAEALTLDTVLITPHSLNDVLIDNGGMAKDIQQLADPGADRILFWDDSASAAAALTVSTGLSISTTNLTTDDSNINHDSLSNFVANEHIDHSSVSVTAGAGLTGGGTIASTRTIDVVGGDGITANANDIALTDAAASSTNPVDISSGAVSLDVEALTTMEGNALAATDTFYVEDGGVSKGIEVQAAGMRVQASQGTQTLAAADMNSIMEFNATATLTLPLNSSVALPIGTPVVVVVDHASQEVTITAATSVTLNSIYHPGGGSAASDKVKAGGTAILFKIAADEWYLSGDIKNS